MKNGILAFILLMSLSGEGQKKSTAVLQYQATDSIITGISNQYEIRSFLHRIIMGKNYRDTWSTPVKLPLFYLSKSGMTIDKLGGGQQTKSLRLKDASGKEWVLRTVDKTVKDAIPQSLNNTPVEWIVQDMISASHPYSPLIVAELAKAAEVIAPVPHMFYVAPDKALGIYHNIFANTVCILEEREPTPDGSGTENTEEVKENIRKSNDHLVLQKQVLKARLLDMLVGDWDRHADQWRWDEIDSANTEYFYAIPRDRDNALFHSGGLLPAIAKVSFMKHISGFKKESTGLKRLNRKSHGFDKTFLNELNAAEWDSIIREFQRQLSNEVIAASVKKLPDPVYRLDGEELERKLRSRRDGLLKNAMRYYDFLSGSVQITGSDEQELFVVTGKGKQLLVTVYRIEMNNRYKIYERLFDPEETGYVHLHGLKGDDQFVVEQNATSSIRLRFYGNEGNDKYDIKGKTKFRIHDTRTTIQSFHPQVTGMSIH